MARTDIENGEVLDAAYYNGLGNEVNELKLKPTEVINALYSNGLKVELGRNETTLTFPIVKGFEIWIMSSSSVAEGKWSYKIGNYWALGSELNANTMYKIEKSSETNDNFTITLKTNNPTDIRVFVNRVF